MYTRNLFARHWRFYFILVIVSLLLGPGRPVYAWQQGRELIHNGGMEGGSGNDGQGGGVPEWKPYGTGYEVNRREHHGGDQCIRCDSLNPNGQHGAQITITLNQTRPIPVRVTGWSKADQVRGVNSADYSIYVDALYTDGTPLYGQIAAFRPGTHDWQRRQVLVLPAKPLQNLTVYALFRNHTGTAWFDDFSAQALSGGNMFDSQPLQFPMRHAGAVRHRLTASDGLSLDLDEQGDIAMVHLNGRPVSADTGGFFMRDVAADGPLTPMRGSVSPRKAGGVNFGCASGALRIVLNVALYAEDGTLAIDGEMQDLTKTDRAVTVYLALPVDAIGWQWGQDIRHTQTISTNREYSNQTQVNVGATGGLSLYPFACVGESRGGVGIASQLDWPSVYRCFYNSASRQFVIAWDFALTGKTAAWPAHNARFRCKLFRIPPGPPEWTFRRAAQRFYGLYPHAFVRRARADGIWIPFTDPSTVQNPDDFDFAYHEGDNSVKSDNARGILSFRYTEPSTYWLPMPPEMPRTYEAAMALIQKQAAGERGREGEGEKNASSPTAQHQSPNPANSGEVEGNSATNNSPSPQDWARAVLDSGTWDETGQYNLEFRNEPWTNGGVFVLNPNPELPASQDKPTRASLAYTIPWAIQRYGDAATRAEGRLDGEYLDSLEGWTDTEDYRPSSIQACPYPIPFDTNSFEPTVPQWYSLHSFVRFVSQDLHNRDRLLMANTTPVRFSIFLPLLDIMGIEVDWLDSEGHWRPDSDEIFNLRRTMSYRKPYLLLMNTNYDRFTHSMVEKYFQRSMFYGVFPSMFSADAATHPYWETPKWYNRDRDLFKKYIPVIRQLSAAGWEPIPNAHTSTPAVYVERYGARLFTLLNDSAQLHDTTVTIDRRALQLTGAAPHVVNLLTGADLPATVQGTNLVCPLRMDAGEAAVLELR